METGITDEPSRASRIVAQVEYVLTPDDHVKCHMYLLDRELETRHPDDGAGGRKVLAVGAVGLGIILAVLAAQGAFCIAGMWAILIGGFMVLAFLAGRGRPVQKSAQTVESAGRRQYADYYRAAAELVLGRRDRVELYAEGLVEFNDTHDHDGGVEVLRRSETRVAWASVESIDVTPTHAIFTVTDKGHPFIPKWAFRDEGAFHAFVEMAERLRQAAGHRAAGAFTTATVDSDSISRRTDEHGPA